MTDEIPRRAAAGVKHVWECKECGDTHQSYDDAMECFESHEVDVPTTFGANS